MFLSFVFEKQVHVHQAYMSCLLSCMLNYTVSSLGAYLLCFINLIVVVPTIISLEIVDDESENGASVEPREAYGVEPLVLPD